MNILLFGHVCIDENVSEKVIYKSWGSPLMYMYEYYKKQTDCKVSLLAPYGYDFLEYLKSAPIINEPKGEHTLTYKNISKNGKRKQICENTQYAQPVRLDEDIKKRINKADVIVLAPLLSNYSAEYVNKLLSHKNPKCLTVLLPQGYFRQVSNDGLVTYRNFSEAINILPLFSMAIVSEEDLPAAEKVLKSWAKKNPNTNIIMTQGEKGASIIDEHDSMRITTVPVPKEKIIDSVGCGDTFSAATVHHFFKTKELEGAISLGNKVAGEKLLAASPIV